MELLPVGLVPLAYPTPGPGITLASSHLSGVNSLRDGELGVTCVSNGTKSNICSARVRVTPEDSVSRKRVFPTYVSAVLTPIGLDFA
jgi:hypothetical protein